MSRICGGVLVERRGSVPFLLLGRRAAGRRWYPGVWDVVGGHVEAGETPERALVREFQEEIGVTPTAWREVGEFVVPASDPGEDPLDFRLYAVTAWTGIPTNRQPEEHDEIAWVALDDACRLDLAHPAYPGLFHRLATTV